MDIIGRQREREELTRLCASKTSEFVMVYGRRRVGKTYLIREFFNQKFAFYTTGVANGDKDAQLARFYSAICKYSQKDLRMPKNWMEAFNTLQELVEKDKSKKKKVIFLDELPWMDTPKSGFIQALDLFWNTWASARTDILLIVCGSAASWMVKNIIKNHGGLHNRLTYQIKLNPFTLNETEEYLHWLGINWDRHHIAECYMALGGIPFYLKLLDKSISLAQNIDKLFFKEPALLADEFENLYASLFKSSADYVDIIEVLAQKKNGYTRNEVIAKLKIADGGSLTRKLDELEQCGFIRKYKSVGETSYIYQLIDFYSLFYFNFIKGARPTDTDTWMHLQSKPRYNTWLGLSFERLCFAHLPQIRQALGIGGISTSSYALYTKEVQIDCVIERADKVINICEMKYTDKTFTITKKYAEEIKKKQTVLKGVQKKKYTYLIVLISANGMEQNEYSANLIQKCISLDSLFLPSI